MVYNDTALTPSRSRLLYSVRVGLQVNHCLADLDSQKLNPYKAGE